MKIILVFLLLLCIVTLSQTKDVTGWNKSYWGMTITEIDSVFKNQIITKEKNEFNESYSNREIQNLEISSDKYRVIFIMNKKTDKLIGVTITPMQKDAEGLKWNFNSLDQMLVDKYGQPSFKYESPITDRNIVESKYVWNFKSTIITLDYYEMKSVSYKSMFLAYEQRNSIDNEKI
jgi:hypothetical protein